ncbi:MAG: hypothetical protein WC876_09170 [Candidatus Thermoplasmatota archaeon]|jgi:hypothetical protein
MATRATLVAFLVAALAGCVSPGDPMTPPPPASLSSPPAWHVGDWWDYHVTDHVAGIEYAVRLAVAGIEGDHYRIGSPAGQFNPALLHVPGPGVGLVGQANLSYRFMGEEFKVIQFPLAQDATWTVRLQGNDLTANVVSVDGLVAEVEMHGPASDIYYTYDAAQGQIVAFENENWVSYELVGNGAGLSAMEWPSGIAQRINAGVFAGVNAQEPGAPVQDVAVEAGIEFMSVFLYAGPAMLPEPAPVVPAGYFLAEIRDPAGQTYTAQYGPTPQTAPENLFALSPEPEGTWRWQTVALGPGVAAISAVSYNLE